MKITQDVRDYAATLGDDEKAALYPHPEVPAQRASKDEVEAGSAAGATGTQKDIMAQMSKKFLNLGAQVYVEAEGE